MKPYDMGVLFDECAEHAIPTTVRLDRPFDIAPEGGTSYDVPALAGLVREVSAWWHAAGARPGDPVAIVKDNHWDYVLLACGAIRLGAVPAQIAGNLDAPSLATLLHRLRPSVLLAGSAVLQRCAEAGVDLRGLARTVLALGEPVPGARSADDVRGTPPPPPRRPEPDAPLVVVHTSGTTGVPKLVVHSTRTVIGTLARFEAVRVPVLAARRDDVLANAGAWAHGRAFCWTASVFCLGPRSISILTGADPDTADPVLRAAPPTIVEATPANYLRLRPLLSRLDNAFRNVRLYLSTFDAIHPPTVRDYLAASGRRTPLWMQGWGQSETGPLTFRFFTRGSVRQRGERHPGTRNLGHPVPGRTRLRVVDPATLRPVPAGRPGLVLAATAATCLGYVGEDDRWAAKRDGRWFNTGDIGVRRRDGSLLLLDREVDHAGVLSCLEIEDVVADRLPEVIECVVLTTRGRPPLPVAVTEDGALDRAAWATAVRDLPPLREPVALRWDEVPRTATGKVRRSALLAELQDGATLPGSGRWT
ncbi:class I adenylate-forming enzyme family protein [Amycolatopsis sp. KNN50.9b]|uniref:class I adenylate-forming enzyme family protein n=1 Tax=Amycolatopsis sp. KNN50.9b TaxID=2018303 RepID=UPI001E47638D|nr:class I adenylate-forming enzyme family protein [Amycolatopsis sp. KNN50.9b]